jgi:hypothetical protein
MAFLLMTNPYSPDFRAARQKFASCRGTGAMELNSLRLTPATGDRQEPVRPTVVAQVTQEQIATIASADG